MGTDRKRRVLAIASGGGHWVQLQRLRPALDGFEVAYASVYPDYSLDVAPARFHPISDVARKSLLNLMVLVPQLLGISVL